jgi:hypothetical protein
MYSFPFTAAGFTVIQLWFFVQHLGLLMGIAALAGAEAMARGRSARWGIGLAVSGMALLAVTELIAITARNSTYPGERTGLLDALYGTSSLAVGVGLILAGVAVRRRGRWTGWRGLVVPGRRRLRVRADDTRTDGAVMASRARRKGLGRLLRRSAHSPDRVVHRAANHSSLRRPSSRPAAASTQSPDTR